MNPTGKYIAVFTGNMTDKNMAAWNALSPAERQAREQKGMEAWMAWAREHQAAIVDMGGPLGKTKKVDKGGVRDINNMMSGFTIVRAGSFEAAAKMFENHPHFAIFPGEGVEIMPVLSIPGM